jgi:hypothetical protein
MVKNWNSYQFFMVSFEGNRALRFKNFLLKRGTLALISLDAIK